METCIAFPRKRPVHRRPSPPADKRRLALDAMTRYCEWLAKPGETYHQDIQHRLEER